MTALARSRMIRTTPLQSWNLAPSSAECSKPEAKWARKEATGEGIP